MKVVGRIAHLGPFDIVQKLEIIVWLNFHLDWHRHRFLLNLGYLFRLDIHIIFGRLFEVRLVETRLAFIVLFFLFRVVVVGLFLSNFPAPLAVVMV